MVNLLPGGGLSVTSGEMVRRLKSLVPTGWFASGNTPVWDALLGGTGDVLGLTTNFLAYAYDQSRIASASTWMLDLVAWDFFGSRFLRRRGEADDQFRERILKEVLRPRSTRSSITQVLIDLTGNAPKLVELWQPGDCGCYDVGTLAYAGPTTGSGPLAGYDDPLAGFERGAAAYVTPSASVLGSPGAGCWGSYHHRNQIFVTAYRTPGPAAAGSGFYDTSTLAYGGGDPAPIFFGYDVAGASYDTGSSGFLTPAPPYGAFAGLGYYGVEQTDATVSDAEIYAAIASVMPAGTIAWTDIENVVTT